MRSDRLEIRQFKHKRRTEFREGGTFYHIERRRKRHALRQVKTAPKTGLGRICNLSNRGGIRKFQPCARRCSRFSPQMGQPIPGQCVGCCPVNERPTHSAAWGSGRQQKGHLNAALLRNRIFTYKCLGCAQVITGLFARRTLRNYGVAGVVQVTQKWPGRSRLCESCRMTASPSLGAPTRLLSCPTDFHVVVQMCETPAAGNLMSSPPEHVKTGPDPY